MGELGLVGLGVVAHAVARATSATVLGAAKSLATLAMQLPPEQDLDTVKRYIATKENESEGILVPPQWCRRRDAALPLARPRPLPLHLVSLRRHAQVLPKTAYETEAEYEARLGALEDAGCGNTAGASDPTTTTHDQGPTT